MVGGGAGRPDRKPEGIAAGYESAAYPAGAGASGPRRLRQESLDGNTAAIKRPAVCLERRRGTSRRRSLAHSHISAMGYLAPHLVLPSPNEGGGHRLPPATARRRRPPDDPRSRGTAARPAGTHCAGGASRPPSTRGKKQALELYNILWDLGGAPRIPLIVVLGGDLEKFAVVPATGTY